MNSKANKDDSDSLYETVIENDYSVRSGVYTAVDSNMSMKLDKYGQYYASLSAVLDPQIYDYSKIEPVCSMYGKAPDENVIAQQLFESIPNIKYKPVIGYYSDLYAGYVAEGDYREKASSGGFTTWILGKLLKEKLIDGVIHVKESGAGSKALFEYGVSYTIEEVRDGAKTRYYPVELSSVIRVIKENPGKYAIVGIPSFIMEIRLLARQDPIIEKRIKFTLGLVCGHQKSTKYAESLAWQCGIRPGNLRSIDFRKKIEGSPANKYATEMVGVIDGKLKTVIKKQDELFGTHWGHGFFKTKFSDFTDDALNETADITLGDAWLPQYTKDSKGTNLLIVRNPIIATILKDGIRRGNIKLEKISEEDVIKSQPGLIHHTRDDLPYRLYKKDIAKKWRPQKRLPASKSSSFLRKRIQDLREDISKQSHILYKQAVELDDWNYFERSMQPYLRQYRRLYALVQLKQKGPVWVTRKALRHLLKK